MKLKRELVEYFKYHPPVTQERKDAHDRVNTSTMVGYLHFVQHERIDNNGLIDTLKIESTYDTLIGELHTFVTEPYCHKWASHALVNAKQAALTNWHDREENIFMYMQQFRMFVNQAITIQELDNI
jgi:hypothetical protein